MIKFLPLGGADDVGANCFYLNIDGTGFLLDCGMHPRKIGLESLPAFHLIKDQNLDYVFVSHAHQDHIGALPFLIQQYPHTIIYSTYQTKEIADVILHNAVNIYSKNFESSPENQFYSHDEINLLVSSIKTIEYNTSTYLRGIRHKTKEKIGITFYDAGHILGSASILIQYREKSLFYTGDINLSNQSIMINADISKVKNIDTLILETTYGAVDSQKIGSWESETNKLINKCNSILHKGGSILIPVFALGKTQELISLLHRQIKKGKLTEVPIYTGGVSTDISKIYDRNRYLTRRRDKEFELGNIPKVNLLEIDDYNLFKKNPGIVLASSGMMIEGTTSFKLLEFWLGQKNFAIYGVGYMDLTTPGFKIMHAKNGDIIQYSKFKLEQKVNCEIERFYFPSHSKREELVNIVDLTNPKKVILVHGDSDAKDWVGANILSKLNHIKLYSAQNGHALSL
jgi:Cft2 family RNA processing exonuclease